MRACIHSMERTHNTRCIDNNFANVVSSMFLMILCSHDGQVREPPSRCKCHVPRERRSGKLRSGPRSQLICPSRSYISLMQLCMIRADIHRKLT